MTDFQECMFELKQEEEVESSASAVSALVSWRSCCSAAPALSLWSAKTSLKPLHYLATLCGSEQVVGV